MGLGPCFGVFFVFGHGNKPGSAFEAPQATTGAAGSLMVAIIVSQGLSAGDSGVMGFFLGGWAGASGRFSVYQAECQQVS